MTYPQAAFHTKATQAYQKPATLLKGLEAGNGRKLRSMPMIEGAKEYWRRGGRTTVSQRLPKLDQT